MSAAALPGPDPSAPAGASAPALPELASVSWRPRADARSLRRRGRIWTATTVAHTIPFLASAVLLVAIRPLLIPVALLALAQAWAIPELYARRGALVVAPRRRGPAESAGA